MKFVLSFALACLALAFTAAPPADAQYPVYVPQNHGHVVPGHTHHSHRHYTPSHYAPSAAGYYSGYGATAYHYAPSVTYAPVYSAGSIYAQPLVPSAPIYHSNNYYYNVPSGHSHHGWHLGHFLMGHH